MSEQVSEDEISARVERLLTAQPSAPPEARRVRRAFPILESRQESARHFALQIRVDAEFADAYRRPGQYVTLDLDGWPARFYVIASRREHRVWEFLVDRRGELGPPLSKLDRGDKLLVSLPEGAGFDATEATDAVAALFCTGSGIATMRPLIETWIADKTGPSKIFLYYGERSSEDFAYGSLLARWDARGTVAVHRAAEDGRLGSGEHRYVQHALASHDPELSSAFVYLSGAPVMVKMVADTVLRRGVLPSRIKINL